MKRRRTYLPLLGMPVLVFEGGAQALTNARSRAVSRGLRPAIYTREMFSTGYDAANRAATAAVPAEALDLVGVAVHGPKSGVGKIFKGAHLHP